jgi:hypothetical protein
MNWLELRQKAQSVGRPLKCPQCDFRFSFRHLARAGKVCPKCKVPIGYSFAYRAALAVAGWSATAYVMYWGCQGEGGSGWLVIGWPFALAAAIAVQVVIQRIIPPRLDVYAEGHTWVKLE